LAISFGSCSRGRG